MRKVFATFLASSLFVFPVSANAGFTEELEILTALKKMNSISDLKIVHSKYLLDENGNSENGDSMVTGFPKQISTDSSCFELPILVAPVDPSYSKSGIIFNFSMKDLKKTAVFSAEVWSDAGVKLSSVYSSDSRVHPLIQDSSSFWAPTSITQVSLRMCDEALISGSSKNYIVALKAGWAMFSQREIREFQETIRVDYSRGFTFKKTTITCVKGKLTKKVTAVKPVCPKGYKKK